MDVDWVGRVRRWVVGFCDGRDCGHASFDSGTTGKTCLQLQRATVGRNVSLAHATITGPVTAEAADISGDLSFYDAAFVGNRTALNLQRCRARKLRLRTRTSPISIDLRYAQVSTIEDGPIEDGPIEDGPVEDEATGDGGEHSEPPVQLLACRYEALDGGKDFTVQKRLKWLRRDPDHYSPQPYDQLMACYRDAGEEPAARAVGLAKLQARRATLPPLGKLLGIIQDWTVGYGYRSWLALIWMAGFVAVGWAFFAIQPPLTTAKSPPFQPFLYSLDLFLPIVDLGQADSFNAVGTGTWVATSLVLAGWALTTALVAGFTRVINRS